METLGVLAEGTIEGPFETGLKRDHLSIFNLLMGKVIPGSVCLSKYLLLLQIQLLTPVTHTFFILGSPLPWFPLKVCV